MVKDLIEAQERHETAAEKSRQDNEAWLVLLTKLVSRHDRRLDQLDGGKPEE
jgi:hypothetical protein